jgi:cyclopropane-fatty-acyl-phospholipid synthase
MRDADSKNPADGLAIVRELLKNYPHRDFAVRLWNGATWQPHAETTPSYTLVINSPDSLRRILLRPNMLSLGRAYVESEFDFEGDIRAAFRLGDYLLAQRWSLWSQVRLAIEVFSLQRTNQRTKQVNAGHNLAPFTPVSREQHSKVRTKDAIAYHYDLPSEFFALWLDANMVYSCAFFTSRDEDLETAQRKKLEYICRKLRLKSGQRLLDWGCGWGALAVYAASRHGAEVLGVTVSEQQAKHARACVERAGMVERCKIELKDYRDVAETQPYDCLVSVGMAEHVSESLLAAYFSRAWKTIKPGGTFLHHAIARSVSTPLRRGPSFMDRYIFPDTELVPINTTLRAAEDSGFEVRDVENLREHYALTLHHWLDRFQRRREEIVKLTNEATYRKFQIYLAGCAHDFECGRLNIFQSLFVRPTGKVSGLPLTRADLAPTTL